MLPTRARLTILIGMTVPLLTLALTVLEAGRRW